MAAPLHPPERNRVRDPEERAFAGDHPDAERIARLEAENEALRQENAELKQGEAECRRAEEVLRESEERLRAVLENSLDAAYRRNLRTDRYDYMSPVIEQILGFTPEEMIAMSIDEVLDHIHPDDRRPAVGEITHAVTSGRGILEYRFRGKDGQYRWLSDHFTVNSDAQGQPLFRSGVVRDVTGQKQAEEERVQLGNALESAHRETSLYLDILTHDIRNANTVSLMYADILIEELEGAEKEYARKLKASIDRSTEILRNVATIRRLHENQISLKSVDLDRVIRMDIAEIPTASIRYSGSPCLVRADDLLPEVFANLIGNAVKHGGPGVEITVRTEEKNGSVQVSVEDTGPGIPDSQKARLFNRFERGQTKASGQGLGLYIVRTLVERYRGRVWVEDRVAGHPEEGAAFRLTLEKA